ncbi:hypothetical protein [Streptomyces sp. NPDC048002]|uniref:hypothetical protein n=1 Tax=unclassified Streptomyces TaxID=2593676 RepID=UPI0033F0CC75
MGVLHGYFQASDHATAVDAAFGPGGVGPGRVLEAGAGRFDARGPDPDVALAALVVHAEAAPRAVRPDGPELVWPEPCDLRQDSAGSDWAWHTGLVLQQLPDRWRDVLADLPEEAVPLVAAQWYEGDDVDFTDYAVTRDTVEALARLARGARAAGGHLYCRSGPPARAA